MCYLQSILSVHCPPNKIFVFMYLSTSILGSQKSCLTFTARIYFLQEEKN